MPDPALRIELHDGMAIGEDEDGNALARLVATAQVYELNQHTRRWRKCGLPIVGEHHPNLDPDENAAVACRQDALRQVGFAIGDLDKLRRTRD